MLQTIFLVSPPRWKRTQLKRFCHIYIYIYILISRFSARLGRGRLQTASTALENTIFFHIPPPSFFSSSLMQEMTVYTFSEYVWQDRSEIGEQIQSVIFIDQQRHNFWLNTRLVYKNNVLTKQWLVFKKRTIVVVDDSDSDAE